MSGRRWIFALLAAVLISATGCQVDGGATKLWNPFVRADKTAGMEDEKLPKFVRRLTDKEGEKSKTAEPPIAESRVKSLLEDGQQALQENHLTEARQAYQEVLQLVPDDPTAHHGLAMVADLTEQWAEAEDHYRQALRSRPRDANLLCDIGYSYLLQNRYSEASSYLSQAIQINPSHENAQTNLALLDLRQGNREAARQRLVQRYGNSAAMTQILTALESQTAARVSTGLAATAPHIPENASFEEIRELANRERIAAQHRRAALNVPVDHNLAIDPVSPVSHAHVPGQNVVADLNASGHQPNRFIGANIDPAVPGNQVTGSCPSVNIVPGNYAPNTGLPLPHSAVAQPVGNSELESQANRLFGNPNFGAADLNTEIMAGAGEPNSMPTVNAMASEYPIVNRQFPANLANSANQLNPQNPSQVNFNNQPPVAANYPTPPTANNASNFGGVIPVRPSGSFQPPVQGVSYGQPLGFGQAPVETANYGNRANSVAPGGTASYANGANINMSGSQSVVTLPSQQSLNVGQNSGRAQLDALNAGPGSLFPIGQRSSAQDGQLHMENVSPPGSNSVINGAMYGQPVSTLPAQEWMMQQQQQTQQLNSQHQIPSQIGQSSSGPQHSGNSPTHPGFGFSNDRTAASGNTTAPRPGNQASSVNPLASYENQLRQLDNQYNNTLQQLDRNASAPRTPYQSAFVQ